MPGGDRREFDGLTWLQLWPGMDLLWNVKYYFFTGRKEGVPALHGISSVSFELGVKL